MQIKNVKARFTNLDTYKELEGHSYGKSCKNHN